jgi:ribosomal protein S18 acetylase RimI-like enzyme
MDRGSQFPYEYSHISDRAGHIISATDTKTGKNAGNIHVKRSGLIAMIHVKQEHRRKGVATGMWEHAKMLSAKGVIPELVHSANLTQEGEAWHQSLGEK